ncbi:DUF3237 domain-containing protein [Pseudomonas citronellolis]|uniref:DUF3237 domain-containing protein n=1 Tax=Pseudomonas citronellolis TaxID=53408 RepID=UPI0018DA0056|nr:DUF3237 domain-containing protein [Pseudomonas citronellolis]MBH3433869.1 DUF3237 domain-containing protein [Pseudomonas citronellolis]
MKKMRAVGSLRSLHKNVVSLICLGLFLHTGVAGANDLKDTKPNRVKTDLVMQINVKLGPEEDLGKGSEGHRINYPIIGGSFVGKGLKGEVIPGGADMSVERNDGVTKIDALYRLKTDDGKVLIIHNYGLWRPTEEGLAKQAKGLALTEADYYCRTVPSFSTPAGKYDWLEDYTYVGTIDDVSDNEVLIGVYRVDGI